MDVVQDWLLKAGVEGVPRRGWTCASADGHLLHEWCLWCKSLDIFSIRVLFSRDPLQRELSMCSTNSWTYCPTLGLY